MAKYTVCTGMGQSPTGLQEFVKEITAEFISFTDGAVIFKNHAGETVAIFKQYVYVLEEGQIPVITAPVRSIRQ
jgi:hypothetical protein